MADLDDSARELDELYGKLDRLLVRRGPDALAERSERPAAEADFPLLTEVIRAEPGSPPETSPAIDDAELELVAAAEAHLFDVITEVVRAEPASTPKAPPAIDEAELMAAVEARLFDLLARQQREVDEAVRRIVREELARRGKR